MYKYTSKLRIIWEVFETPFKIKLKTKRLVKLSLTEDLVDI